jgi:prephenate dehydratase
VKNDLLILEQDIKDKSTNKTRVFLMTFLW